jgi:hypothetical protein
MQLVSTQILDLAVLSDITTAVTGCLVAAEVDLVQNDAPFDRASLIGDYDLADYTGYAAEAVTWLAPSVADDGSIELVGLVGEFRPTDAVTPNVIFGLLLRNAGGDILFAARFDAAPLSMGSALNSIVVTIRVVVSPTGVVVTVS